MKSKMIVIASSKGGVGKSTVALGIAEALADDGNKVLLCDLDFGNACLDILACCEDRVIYTAVDAAEKRCTVDSAIVETDKRGLSLLACPAGGKVKVSSDGEVTPEAVLSVVRDASELEAFDYVIIDTGAGVNPVTDEAAKLADEILVVSGHNPISLRAAESTVERLSGIAECDIRLVVNQFEAESILRKKSSRRGLLDIIDSSKARLAGVVPYDYSLMLRHEGLRVRIGHSDRAFENIAARLSGESVPVFSGMGKIRKKRAKFYK